MTRNPLIETPKDDNGSKPDSQGGSPIQHPEQSRPAPGEDNDPKRGGYHHADTAMGTRHSEALSQLEQTITGREPTQPADGESSGDPGEIKRR
jgi:hypothetical protein